MILPVYRALNVINHPKALEFYNLYKNFYHPIAA